MLFFHHTKFSFHLQNSFFLSLRPECLWNIAKLWQMRHKKALLANHPHLASSIYTFLVQIFIFSKEIFTFLPLFSISYFCVFANIWPFFFSPDIKCEMKVILRSKCCRKYSRKMEITKIWLFKAETQICLSSFPSKHLSFTFRKSSVVPIRYENHEWMNI